MMGKGTMLLASVVFIITGWVQTHAAFNYGEVLQKSLYFYECQQSGPLPEWNRVEWRGPSCLNDGKDVGKDLTGGWFDAGDHVKFNFPMAASTTLLAWGGIEYKNAYVKSGQYPILQNNLRFVCDYFIRCHTAENEFYGQVGNGGLDHAFWGPAESVEADMERPSYKITASKPGSDLAGEAAAALASCGMLFKETDPAYSKQLIDHAKQLYDFADKYRGKYPEAIPDAQGYYNSHSGFQDEIVWGAIWLYKATGDEAYLQKAKEEYEDLNTQDQSEDKSFKWTIAWDDKSYGCYVLMAQITGEEKYHADVQHWLDFWTVGYKENKIKYTPGGLAWLSEWGSNRYACNTAFVAMIYSDKLEDAELKKRYHDFAVSQINYALGDNPIKRSLVVGFGENPPVRPHHRTCEGIYPGDASDTVASLHTLYGALVGGPGSDDSYKDERNNYYNNEVACDYNAAFTGLAARMYQEFGGDPLPNFPQPEPKEAEYWVEASVNSSGTNFTEIRSVLKNQSRWPAHVADNLRFRYYMDLSEVSKAGIDPGSITISSNHTQGKNTKISALTQFEGNIYYVEIDFSDEKLYPGRQQTYKLETQFRIAIPVNSADGAWDPENDWSYKGLAHGYNASAPANNMPVFLGDEQVYGADYNSEPFDPTPISNGRKSIKYSTVNKIAFTLNSNNTTLFIQGQQKNKHQVAIWSLDGRSAENYLVDNLPAAISIAPLRSGCYFVRVCDVDGTVAQKSFTIRR